MSEFTQGQKKLQRLVEKAIDNGDIETSYNLMQQYITNTGNYRPYTQIMYTLAKNEVIQNG